MKGLPACICRVQFIRLSVHLQLVGLRITLKCLGGGFLAWIEERFIMLAIKRLRNVGAYSEANEIEVMFRRSRGQYNS